MWKREADGATTAKFKLHSGSPTYTTNTITWIDPHQGRIHLCYKSIESTDPNNQMFNGPCPQDIVASYKIDNIPAGHDPSPRIIARLRNTDGAPAFAIRCERAPANRSALKISP